MNKAILKAADKIASQKWIPKWIREKVAEIAISFTIFVESTFNKAATYVAGDAIVEVLDIDWSKQSDKMSVHKDINGRSGDLPSTSTPNSSQDLYVNGELWQRRFYDNNGDMVKDIDFLHGNGSGKHTFPHEHFWEWINGKPHRK